MPERAFSASCPAWRAGRERRASSAAGAHVYGFPVERDDPGDAPRDWRVQSVTMWLDEALWLNRQLEGKRD
jgi:hypothetical protein